MIVQQLATAPRFIRGKEGEVTLSTRLTIAITAESAEEETQIRQYLEENIK